MFLLFYSLYRALFIGSFQLLTYDALVSQIRPIVNGLGKFVTSIFGDNTFDTLGETLFNYGQYDLINIVALVLALITSIGIVVMAVKGIKRIFSVFFYGVR